MLVNAESLCALLLELEDPDLFARSPSASIPTRVDRWNRRLLRARTPDELTAQILNLPQTPELAEPRAWLCEKLGLDASRTAAEPTEEIQLSSRQILSEVERLKACVSALEESLDSPARSLAIDDDVIDGRTLIAIVALRSELGLTIHQAIDAYQGRFDELSRSRPISFADRPDTSKHEFYS